MMLFVVANVELILLLVLCVVQKFKFAMKQRAITQKRASEASVIIDVNVEIPHAFLIYADNRSVNIRETIVSIVSFTDRKDVFVVANVTSMEQKEKIKFACEQEGVQFMTVRQAHKTRSQLIGCYKLMNCGYKYVTLCDGEVVLKQWNKAEVLNFFNETAVKCVSYLVTQNEQEPWSNVLNRCAIECALSKYMRLVQGQLSGCGVTSGVISTWEIDAVLDLLLCEAGEVYIDYFDEPEHDTGYKVKVSNVVIEVQNDNEVQNDESLKMSRYYFMVEYTKGILIANGWSINLIYIMCWFCVLVDVMMLVSLGMIIAFAVNQPIYTIILIWQTIAVNTLTIIVCWYVVIKSVVGVLGESVIIMPFAYNQVCVPGFYMDIPPVLVSMTVPFFSPVF
jgi:hypothetical protein